MPEGENGGSVFISRRRDRASYGKKFGDVPMLSSMSSNYGLEQGSSTMATKTLCGNRSSVSYGMQSLFQSNTHGYQLVDTVDGCAMYADEQSTQLSSGDSKAKRCRHTSHCEYTCIWAGGEMSVIDGNIEKQQQQPMPMIAKANHEQNRSVNITMARDYDSIGMRFYRKIQKISSSMFSGNWPISHQEVFGGATLLTMTSLYATLAKYAWAINMTFLFFTLYLVFMKYLYHSIEMLKDRRCPAIMLFRQWQPSHSKFSNVSGRGVCHLKFSFQYLGAHVHHYSVLFGNLVVCFVKISIALSYLNTQNWWWPPPNKIAFALSQSRPQVGAFPPDLLRCRRRIAES